MKDAKFQEIRSLVERFDKLPDAAFIAAMGEHGVDEDDLMAYSREASKRERAIKSIRRVRR